MIAKNFTTYREFLQYIAHPKLLIDNIYSSAEVIERAYLHHNRSIIRSQYMFIPTVNGKITGTFTKCKEVASRSYFFRKILGVSKVSELNENSKLLTLNNKVKLGILLSKDYYDNLEFNKDVLFELEKSIGLTENRKIYESVEEFDVKGTKFYLVILDDYFWFNNALKFSIYLSLIRDLFLIDKDNKITTYSKYISFLKNRTLSSTSLYSFLNVGVNISFNTLIRNIDKIVSKERLTGFYDEALRGLALETLGTNQVNRLLRYHENSKVLCRNDTYYFIPTSNDLFYGFGISRFGHTVARLSLADKGEGRYGLSLFGIEWVLNYIKLHKSLIGDIKTGGTDMNIYEE